MRKIITAAALAVSVAAPALAQQAPAALQSWGSFHVGGREVVISGQAVREVVFSPGGVPARVDPNGTYLMGMIYAQSMVPANPRGQAPILWPTIRSNSDMVMMDRSSDQVAQVVQDWLARRGLYQ
jgi:hypothetical protein